MQAAPGPRTNLLKLQSTRRGLWLWRKLPDVVGESNGMQQSPGGEGSLGTYLHSVPYLLHSGGFAPGQGREVSYPVGSARWVPRARLKQ